jgi:UDP-GlcNAc3NAcA epimerase
MPEEINRILTDHASELLFAPTETAKDRLISEGIPLNKIIRTGDVMLDAAIHYSKIAEVQSDITNTLSINEAKYALCTLHRAENVDDPETLDWIVEGLSELSNGMTVVLPLHPRTRMRLNEFSLFEKLNSKVKIIDPLGFLDILALQKSASVIVTDSGGMQKEAFFQKKPCVTVRTETEWVELLPGGHNRLAIPLKDSMLSKVDEALEVNLDWSVNLYGDGKSSKTIAEALIKFCSE